MVGEKVVVWRDVEGRFWVLADAGIDREIFEVIGDPVFDEATGRWYQEVALRFSEQPP